MFMLQRLVYFQQGYELTGQIHDEAKGRIQMVTGIAIANVHKAREDRNWAKELVFQLKDSLKQLEVKLRESLAKANEEKRQALIEKDVVIIEISRSLMK